MDIVEELEELLRNWETGSPYLKSMLCDAKTEIAALRQQLLESERLRAHLGAQIAKLAQEAVDNFKPLTEEKENGSND